MKGTTIKTTATILQKVSGSLLSILCDEALKKDEKIMSLDRDAQPFQDMIRYLESDQTNFPGADQYSQNQISLLEKELHHWKITNLKYQHATVKNLLKIEKVFEKEPAVFEGSPG